MFTLRLATLQKCCTFRNYFQTFRRCCSQKSINISEPSVQKYFDNLVKEHDSLLLKDERSSVEVRRLREIKSVVSVLAQRTYLQKYIASIKDSHMKEEDEELKKMMEEEYEMNRKRAKEVDIQLQTVLLEPFMSKSGILLVIVASEGDNAKLFAKELFHLYTSYAKFKNWGADVASVEESQDGFKRASILIEGLGALELMNFEKGVHHRISNEQQANRISTVTVSVLLQPTESEMDVPSSELTVETKEEINGDADSNGHVYLTHTPTGTSVKCKVNKSNKLNEYVAMKELATLLFHHKQNIPSEEEKDAGLIQSDRIIRTYDCSRDRVMEHRGGEDSQHRLKTFMEGGELLERVQDSLLFRQRYQDVMNDISKFDKKKESECSGRDEKVYTPGSM